MNEVDGFNTEPFIDKVDRGWDSSADRKAIKRRIGRFSFLKLVSNGNAGQTSHWQNGRPA